MAYGPVSFGSAQALDPTRSPGASPITSILQLDAATFQVSCAIPTTDDDGTELTGATRHTLAAGPYNADGSNPAENLSMEQVTAQFSNVVHTPLDASAPGTVKDVNIPVVALGQFQWFASSVTDSPV